MPELKSLKKNHQLLRNMIRIEVGTVVNMVPDIRYMEEKMVSIKVTLAAAQPFIQIGKNCPDPYKNFPKEKIREVSKALGEVHEESLNSVEELKTNL